MRILQLIHSEKIGGVYSIANGIFLNWQNQDEIFMFVLRVRSHEPNTKQNKFINTTSNFRGDLKNLRNFINDNKINVVHCHANWQNLYLVLILKALRLIKVKTVFHQHALLKLSSEYDSKSFYITKVLLAFADLCIAASDITKDYLLKNSWIRKDKVVVLDNFVHVDSINGENITDTEAFRKNKDDFKIGFAGRIVPLKDWRTFVESYTHLPLELKSKISYYVAGAGYEEKLLAKYLSDNPSLKVYFVGKVSNMLNFYRSLNLFVSTSTQESFGLTVVEAQMSAVPVISSNIEGINKIITDGWNGILFKTGDPQDLASKVEIIYKDDALRNKLIENGRESSKQFDIKPYLERLEQLYQELIV